MKMNRWLFLSVAAFMLVACTNGSNAGAAVGPGAPSGSTSNGGPGSNGDSGSKGGSLSDDDSFEESEPEIGTVKGRFCSMETDYSTYVQLESKLFGGGFVTVSVKRKGDVATARLVFEDVSRSEFLSVCNTWRKELESYMKLDASAKCNEDTMKMTAEGEYIGKKSPETAFADAAEEAEEYCSDLN